MSLLVNELQLSAQHTIKMDMACRVDLVLIGNVD